MTTSDTESGDLCKPAQKILSYRKIAINRPRMEVEVAPMMVGQTPSRDLGPQQTLY